MALTVNQNAIMRRMELIFVRIIIMDHMWINSTKVKTYKNVLAAPTHSRMMEVNKNNGAAKETF